MSLVAANFFCFCFCWLAVYYRLFFLFVILSNKQTKEAKNKNFPTMFLEIIYLPNGKTKNRYDDVQKNFSGKKSFFFDKNKTFLVSLLLLFFIFIFLFVCFTVNQFFSLIFFFWLSSFSIHLYVIFLYHHF